MMMRDLFPAMRKKDREEIVNSLDCSDVNMHIGASWELAVLWALHKRLGAKPHLRSNITSKKPDAEVEIGLERPLAIEIKSFSGDTFAFRSYLFHASKSINALWHEVRTDEQSAVRIRYHEWRNHRGVRRHPSVIKEPGANNDLRHALAKFAASEEGTATVNIRGVIWATFQKMKSRGVTGEYSCDIPSYIQDVENSQTVNAIDRTSEQLIPFQDTHYIGVIICDGGNSILSQPTKYAGLALPKAADMYNRIVEDANLDFAIAVGVDEGFRSFDGHLISNPGSPGSKRCLVTHIFPHADLPVGAAELLESELCQAIETIPLPRLLPYQARRNIEDRLQRNLTPTIYAESKISFSTARGHAVHISSKALLAFLRGEMPASEFANHSESFRKLASGQKISGIRLDKLGHEFDDDYVVFELEKDDTEISLGEINKSIT